MEWVNVCACVTTALAVQQNRPSLVVVSDGPSSPLARWPFRHRRPGSLSARHRPGLRARRAKKARWSSSVAPAGPRAEAGAPPGPLPPGQPARRKAVSAGPLLSMPGFFLLRTCVCVRRLGTVGNITPETATEQGILEIASSASESQRQQHVLPGKPPPEQLPRGMIETERRSSFPALSPPAGQRRQSRKESSSRRTF